MGSTKEEVEKKILSSDPVVSFVKNKLQYTVT
jgi:hypothetical protein